MKPSIFLACIVSLFMITTLHAETISVEEANHLYAEKQYLEAAAMYEEILDTQGVSPELYYNLGNAYFRLNELGKSIVNYERALRLSPGFADAKFNLEFANRQVVDNIALSDTFFLKRWLDAVIKFYTTNTWYIIAAVFFILALPALLIFIFGRNKLMRKSFFYIGFVFFLVSALSIVFARIQLNHLLNHDEGVIMTGAVVVKGSPDQSGTELFQLHEGTKVKVESELGEWYEIKLANGSIGWIEIKHVEKI
jgi:tetratricopeptide (TPR) repeat protein